MVKQSSRLSTTTQNRHYYRRRKLNRRQFRDRRRRVCRKPFGCQCKNRKCRIRFVGANCYRYRRLSTTSGVLTFTPGDISKTIAVPIVGDAQFEGNETFAINLSIPVNAIISDSEGIGTILDDDASIGDNVPPQVISITGLPRRAHRRENPSWICHHV